MTKADLVEKIAAKANLTKAAAERALNAFLASVEESLAKDDKLTLTGFGTFVVVRLLLHRHDQRALGFHAEAPGLDGFEHLRDILLRVTFTEPYVKAYTQIVIVALEVFNGHAQDVLGPAREHG